MTALIEKTQIDRNAYRVVTFVILFNIVFISIFKVKMRPKRIINLIKNTSPKNKNISIINKQYWQKGQFLI